VTSRVARFFARGDAAEADPHLITAGPIQSDGSFSVKTHRQGFTYDGAVAGEYRLVVMTDKKTPAGERVPVHFELAGPASVERRENTLAVKIQR
jgi:hypothetical protein